MNSVANISPGRALDVSSPGGALETIPIVGRFSGAKPKDLH